MPKPVAPKPAPKRESRPAPKPAPKPEPKPAAKPSGGSSSQAGSTPTPSKAPTAPSVVPSSSGGFGVLDEAFITRSKPESVAAAQAVQESLSVAFIDGTFKPWQRSDELKTYADRQKKEDYPAWNGRPTVVFYTCAGATKTQVSQTKQKVESVFELQSSVMSSKAYAEIFDVVKSVQACIYSMFVNLVKVDISNVTPEQDPFINNETGPFMGFFNVDGQCVSMLQGSQLGSRSYVLAISQLIGNPAASMERYTQVKSGLDKLEQLTRQQFLMNMDLQQARERAQKSDTNKIKSMGSGDKNSLSTRKSLDEIRAEEIQVKISGMNKDISGTRSSLHGLTGRAVGCEGCPVCLEKAAAAAAGGTIASVAEEASSSE